jgi:hypothetical protein
VGKVVQPLQSVNCLESRAHGHERHGPFTQLVGTWFSMVWILASGHDWVKLLQGCKAIIYLLFCGKIVWQSFGLSGFLDPLPPVNDLIFRLGL